VRHNFRMHFNSELWSALCVAYLLMWRAYRKTNLQSIDSEMHIRVLELSAKLLYNASVFCRFRLLIKCRRPDVPIVLHWALSVGNAAVRRRMARQRWIRVPQKRCPALNGPYLSLWIQDPNDDDDNRMFSFPLVCLQSEAGPPAPAMPPPAPRCSHSISHAPMSSMNDDEISRCRRLSFAFLRRGFSP